MTSISVGKMKSCSHSLPTSAGFEEEDGEEAGSQAFCLFCMDNGEPVPPGSDHLEVEKEIDPAEDGSVPPAPIFDEEEEEDEKEKPTSVASEEPPPAPEDVSPRRRSSFMSNPFKSRRSSTSM